jgi:hypothetical protein
VLAKINSSYAVSPEQEARIRAALDAQENERKAA